MPTFAPEFPKQPGSPNLRQRFLLLSLFVFLASPIARATEFSQENASAVLKTLVLEIGPRPMGSPAEQKALDFAAGKFREYGCDTAFVLPMTVAEGVNTRSGVAVGVKHGSTGRIIVIGGHIDTSSPEVPGANDDGSGVACVMELARVLCKRENQSTVVFCCWGGEEQGLRGSRHFVDTFPLLDSIVLVLQIDMADGAGPLIADPDGTRESAPAWLLRAAFDISRNELTRNDLVYHTGLATWNLAVGGAFGSDHIPFIDKGIPAIDFTSDVGFPIHTPQDTWENFTPSGLKRSGDLVLKLFERFDGGVPSRTTERYQAIDIGGRLIILPYWMLWALVVLACGVAVVTFVLMRRRRNLIEQTTRIRWSGFKLLVAVVVGQFFLWQSETLLGLLKGYRFPWVNNTVGFWVFGALAGLLAVWLLLQALRRFRLTTDAFVFARVSLILFVVVVVLTALLTPELAMYPSLALLFCCAAMLVRRIVAKGVFIVAAAAVMYKLIFPEGMMLLQRALTMNTLYRVWQNVLYEAGFVILFSILSLPLAYAFAAAYRTADGDLFWLKRFRQTGGLVAVLAALAPTAVYLYAQPVYDRLWFSTIRIEERLVPGDSVSHVIEVKGSEPLRGTLLHMNGRDSLLTHSGNSMRLPAAASTPVGWAQVSSHDTSRAFEADTIVRVDRLIELNTALRPLRVDAIFESDRPFAVESPWAHGGRERDPDLRETDRRIRFSWYAFPQVPLRIPVRLRKHPEQRITQSVRVTFDSLASSLRLHREFTNVVYRTIVTVSDTIGPLLESSKSRQ